jgi:cytochrome c2
MKYSKRTSSYGPWWVNKLIWPTVAVFWTRRTGGRARLLACLCGLVPVLSAANAPPAQGASSPAFDLSCASCHTVREGEANTFGPNLFGVVGRASGAAPDFEYSPALAGGKVQWTEQALDRFLASPSQFAPGTSMPFGGLARASDRGEIIAFLKAAGSVHRK